MKKILLVLFPLTVMATVAMASDKDYYVYAERGAQASTVSMNDFDGPYAKLASGLALPSATVDDNGHRTPIQIPVIGSVGISHVWNQFYLGGEAQFGYNFVAQKAAYSASDSHANFETAWQTMATVQVGGVISQTNIIYLDAGYALGHFNYDVNSSPSVTSRTSFTQGGPVVGLGTSLQLADHVNFDMNYHFVYYLKKTTTAGDIKAKQNIMTAGLSFHF